MRLQVILGYLTLHKNWPELLEVIPHLGFVITLANFGGEVNKKFIQVDSLSSKIGDCFTSFAMTT
jgi:hypothetical protein